MNRNFTMPRDSTSNFIDGEYRKPKSGQSMALIDPHTEEEWARCAASTAVDVDEAVAAAELALQPWQAMGFVGRRNVLLKLADAMEREAEDLARLETAMTGTPLSLQTPVIAALANDLRYFASMSLSLTGDVCRVDGMHVVVEHVPLGVCGIICPWNLPLWSMITKLGPCLAMGNTAVVKPSEFSPLTALRVAELAAAAGLPRGALNVVVGTGAAAGAALTSHMRIRKVSFTGSTAVGRLVMKAAAESNLKRVALELGGKSPIIVADDANVDAAVDIALLACFCNNGEICTAGSRVYVSADMYDTFCQRAAEKLAQKTVGDANSCDVGPLVNRLQYEKVIRFIEGAKTAGATVACGGGRPPSLPSRGYFVAPTLLTNVTESMEVAHEEIFGPVLVVMKYERLEDAIARANALEYGLAAGVVSSDGSRALAIGKQIQSGYVWLNCYHAVFPNVEFGGVKASGFGREGGRSGVEEWTTSRTMLMPIPTL